MARTPKAGKTEPQSRPANGMDGPHHYLYPDRNAEEDRLVTTLMLAGEALATPLRQTDTTLLTACNRYARPEGREPTALTEDFTDLLDLVQQIRDWIAREDYAPALLTQVRQEFGNGDTLPVLFSRLFPSQKFAPVPDLDGKPILSEREVDILREAAGDISQDEIGARLSITTETVNTHFKRIYKKLGVRRPMQAVARAVAMGYLEVDTLSFVQEAARCGRHEFCVFNGLLGSAGSLEQERTASLESLAGFALMLLAVCGRAAGVARNDAVCSTPAPGLVRELDAQGRVVRSFGQDYLRGPVHLALAPVQAATHGFTPGNLFVGVGGDLPEQGLNSSAVAEFTPEGQFVRAFYGGREIDTRLFGLSGLTFAPDGRLLATSGGMTDALLAFSAGGASVLRFATLCPIQIAAGPFEQIYAIQYSEVGCIVKVFDLQGNLLHTLGGTSAGVSYSGLAVNSAGHVYVSRFAGVSAGVIEEYDAKGGFQREFDVVGFHKAPYDCGPLAVDTHDRLYVPCPRTGDIKIYAPDGTLVQQIDLRGQVVPYSVTIADNGRLWVYGFSV